MSTAIPRFEFDQLSSRLQDILRPRVERLGYLGEFFKCAGNQPDILAPFMEMTEALKKALPDRLTELGALTVATIMANEYERNQHERLSRKLGFGEAWISAVERISPDLAIELEDNERAVQRLIIAVLGRNGLGVQSELDTVIDLIGPAAAVAVMFLVGRYVTHALIVNGLSLNPPVPSIFTEEQRL